MMNFLVRCVHGYVKYVVLINTTVNNKKAMRKNTQQKRRQVDVEASAVSIYYARVVQVQGSAPYGTRNACSLFD